MTEPDAAPVLVAREGAVGLVTLNRPERFNCISSALMAGLTAALEGFEADRGVRAVLLAANGKAFCTGADLDEVLAARAAPDRVQAFIRAGHALMRRFEASPLPIVGAVHGLALAGGIELVMACDVVFAAMSARFGDQHAAFGLVPGWGGTQRLPRIVGLRRALDLMVSARWLSAGEALDWGLVNYVVADDELSGAALDYCRTLASRSPAGLAAMKRLARAGLEGSLDAGLALEERDVVPALGAADVDEGLAAFRERRPPTFGERQS